MDGLMLLVEAQFAGLRLSQRGSPRCPRTEDGGRIGSTPPREQSRDPGGIGIRGGHEGRGCHLSFAAKAPATHSPMLRSMWRLNRANSARVGLLLGGLRTGCAGRAVGTGATCIDHCPTSSGFVPPPVLCHECQAAEVGPGGHYCRDCMAAYSRLIRITGHLPSRSGIL